MPDHSQTIVDIDATASECKPIAEALRRWLVDEGIILALVSDSILGGKGHRPGPRWRDAVLESSSDRFLDLITNGVEIRTGRRVFDAGGNGIELVCHHCGNPIEPGDSWTTGVTAWLQGDDDASFVCPICRAADRLTDWGGPFPWGFGYVGITFWNWPPLSDRFGQALSEQLRHRTVLVRGRL